MSQKLVKERKRRVIVLVFTLTILILAYLIAYFNPFNNTSNEFDYSIFWTAVGSIGSILAFAGLIYTISKSDKDRIVQNKIETRKQLLNQEQESFKKEVIEQLNIFNVSNLIALDYTATEYTVTSTRLLEYQLNLKKAMSKITWYYSDDKYNYKDRDIFLEEYEKYIDKNLKFVDAIHHAFFKYHYAKSIEERQIEWAELDKNMLALIHYNNNFYLNLLDLAKRMIEERQILIIDNINDIQF